MSKVEYQAVEFTVDEDGFLQIRHHLGRFDDIKWAEKEREYFLSDFPYANPQMVQVIQIDASE